MQVNTPHVFKTSILFSLTSCFFFYLDLGCDLYLINQYYHQNKYGPFWATIIFISLPSLINLIYHLKNYDSMKQLKCLVTIFMILSFFRLIVFCL